MSDQTKHSPEPWAADDPDYRGGIVDASGDVVCCGDDYAIDWEHHSDRPGNLRRALACVNALAGIPTEALGSGALEKALEAAVYVSNEFWQANGADGSGGYDAEKSLRAALRSLGRLP